MIEMLEVIERLEVLEMLEVLERTPGIDPAAVPRTGQRRAFGGGRSIALGRR